MCVRNIFTSETLFFWGAKGHTVAEQALCLKMFPVIKPSKKNTFVHITLTQRICVHTRCHGNYGNKR